MINAGLSYDEAVFEKAFSNSILSYGLLESYKKVLYPMIVKIGLLWSTTELMPAQEHFISNMIKQKMFAAIDSLNEVIDDSEHWLLFLPEKEQHELGLLIANYGLRLKGKKVTYLGENVPIENLYEIAQNIKPTHYLTFSVKQNQNKTIQEFLNTIDKDFIITF